MRITPRLTNPVILSLEMAGAVSIHTDSLLILSVNQTIGCSALGLQPLKFARRCQHVNGSSQLRSPQIATGPKPLPMRWPPPTCSLLSMARARPSCPTEAAKLSGHVRTVSHGGKIKETGPVLFTPPGPSVWDLTHPGTAGFPKAAVQNRDPRGAFEWGIGAPSLCLFYFVLHHYLMDGRGSS